jgi:hypothetical protein
MPRRCVLDSDSSTVVAAAADAAACRTELLRPRSMAGDVVARPLVALQARSVDQPFEARSIQPIRPPSLTHLRGWERLPLLVVAASPFAEAAGLRRAHEGRQRTALNILSRAARHNPHETLRRQAARPPRAEIVVLSCTTYLYVRFA